jgi:hypothetical protein
MYIFSPSGWCLVYIPIWVNFGGSCNGKCWCILLPFCQFYGPLVYFKPIWYFSPRLGIFYPVLVYNIQKNLATLRRTEVKS